MFSGFVPGPTNNVILGGGYSWSPFHQTVSKWHGVEYWDNQLTDSELAVVIKRWQSTIRGWTDSDKSTHLINASNLSLDGSAQGIDGVRTVFDFPYEDSPRAVISVPSGTGLWSQMTTGFSITSHPSWGTKQISFSVAPPAGSSIQLVF
jgi:hypothetical protein